MLLRMYTNYFPYVENDRKSVKFEIGWLSVPFGTMLAIQICRNSIPGILYSDGVHMRPNQSGTWVAHVDMCSAHMQTPLNIRKNKSDPLGII